MSYQANVSNSTATGEAAPLGSPWSPVVISRVAAALALLGIVGETVYFGTLSPPLGPPEPSASKLVTWTMTHQQQLLFQFVPGYLAVLSAVLIALLIHLNSGRGIVATLAYVGVAANLSVSLVGFGLFFGTWTYIQRGGTSDGVLALATIAPTFTHSGLMAQGLAVGCIGLIALRARVWPVWLSWFTIIAGLEQFLTDIAFASGPAFSTTSRVLTIGGVARPLDLLVGLVWPIAVAVVLLVRPVRRLPEDRGVITPASTPTL